MWTLFLTGYFGSALCCFHMPPLGYSFGSPEEFSSQMLSWTIWLPMGQMRIKWNILGQSLRGLASSCWHLFFDTSCWSYGNCQVNLHRKRCTENYRELQRCTENWALRFTTSPLHPVFHGVLLWCRHALSEVSHDAFQIDLGWIGLGICSWCPHPGGLVLGAGGV